MYNDLHSKHQHKVKRPGRAMLNNYVFSLISNNANSILCIKLAYFRDRFEININRCTLNDNIKKNKLSTVINDDELLRAPNCCANGVETWGPDLPFVGQVGHVDLLADWR